MNHSNANLHCRSLLIDTFRRETQPTEALCTFIYCDYNQREEQTTSALLSSLLQQLLQATAEESLIPEWLRSTNPIKSTTPGLP